MLHATLQWCACVRACVRGVCTARPLRNLRPPRNALTRRPHAATHHTTPCRRLETRPHAITWEQVEREAATGKTFVSPFPDRERRPVVMMRPRCVVVVGGLGSVCLCVRARARV